MYIAKVNATTVQVHGLQPNTMENKNGRFGIVMQTISKNYSMILNVMKFTLPPQLQPKDV